MLILVNYVWISGYPKKRKEKGSPLKVRPILKRVLKGCLNLPRPTMICFDEHIVLFTGRCPVCKFLPGKPNRTGLKVFILGSPGGSVLDFETYMGKNSFTQVQQMGISGNAVWATLLRGSLVYFDMYFSFILLDALQEIGLLGTGTIQKN